VKHQKDIEQELSRWAHILADKRFDLLEKISLELATANGTQLPAKFRVVMQVRRHAGTATNNIDTRREWSMRPKPDCYRQLTIRLTADARLHTPFVLGATTPPMAIDAPISLHDNFVDIGLGC